LKTTIIATVGASLIGNIKRNVELNSMYEMNEFKKIADYMITKITDERSLGAEVNSVESILKEKFLDERKNLYLLVSDTETGIKTGEILKNYFENSPDSNFENVYVKITEKLNDENREDFKRYGLRNIVKNMAEIIKKHGTETIINATGGYKAQIAFALALGQGMDIPVYYMFERFPTVIKLPPLPLSLDYKLYTEYLYFIDQFDEEEIIIFDKETENQYKVINEKLIPLFDIERVDREKYIALNPMGQVFVESAKFYYGINKQKELKLSERKNSFIFQYANSEGHSKEIINSTGIEKIFENIPFIERVILLGNSESERSGKHFRIKIMGNYLKCSVYCKNGILDMKIETTAQNPEELFKGKEEIKSILEKIF